MDQLFLDSRPVRSFCYGVRADLFRRAARSGLVLIVPDVIRYETRRAILVKQRDAPKQTMQALALLDELCDSLFLSTTTLPILDRAAEMWADASLRGMKTSGDNRIDFDVIVAAHMEASVRAQRRTMVLTSNVRHFEQHGMLALEWDDFDAWLTAAGY